MSRGVALTLTACLGMLLGCATIDDLSGETYRRMGVASLRTETIGLLPMVGGGAVRGFLESAESIFVERLNQNQPGRPWMDPGQSLARIHEAGLESTLTEWARGERSGLPPTQEPLRRMGEAMGTRYLLLTRLHSIELTEGATQVRVTAKLWDSREGETVWEGVGEGRGYVFLVFPWVPSSFEKTMEVASDGLTRRIP